MEIFKPTKSDVLEVVNFFAGIVYCLPLILIFNAIASKFNIQIGFKTFFAYSILFMFLYMFQDRFKTWFTNMIERKFFSSDKTP